MTRPPIRLRSAWLAATLLFNVACGNYISYGEGDGLRGAPGEVSAPVVLDDLPELKRLNHSAFAGLIAQHTVESEESEDVLVDYDAIRASEEATYELERYAATLASLDPLKLESKAERFAYFINAYNASVIRGVLARYKGDAATFNVERSEGFFRQRLYTLGGVVLSLDQIENLAIRGKFDEPSQTEGLDEETLQVLRQWFEATWEGEVPDARLHAAVNCGALGCPNLLAHGAYVYRAEELEEQLEERTRAWLQSAEKGAGPQGISMLFNWFKQDFIDDAGSVEAFIEAHRDGGVEGVDLTRRLEYDWTLNAPGNAP